MSVSCGREEAGRDAHAKARTLHRDLTRKLSSLVGEREREDKREEKGPKQQRVAALLKRRSGGKASPVSKGKPFISANTATRGGGWVGLIGVGVGHTCSAPQGACTNDNHACTHDPLTVSKG